MNPVVIYHCKIQGSKTEPYLVSFILQDNKLMITCTCAAGLLAQLCKHRLGILKGEIPINDNQKIYDIDFLQNTLNSATGLEESIKLIDSLELELEKIKSRTKVTKKMLGRQMQEGIPINAKKKN